MKVLNLCCEHQHRFEGWFASELDFQSQQDQGLLTCPVCDSKGVVRLPSAPRLSRSKTASAGARREQVSADDRGDMPASGAPVDPQLQAQTSWWKAVHQVLRNTEDVGDRFAEEARRIHYGESKERGIRGRASPDEARALQDEGIEVAALPIPAGLKNPVQ